MSDKEKINFLLLTLKELLEAWEHIESKDSNRRHHAKLGINKAVRAYVEFIQEQIKDQK